MERKVFGRGVAALCLALVLGFGCLSAGASPSVAYAGTASQTAYTAEEFEITQDGVTYSCETTDKGTAEITDIVADDSVTAVNVPGSIEHGGQTYKVTKLYFSSGIVAENVEQLTLPDTLEKMYGWNFRKFAKVKELHIPGSIKDFSCTLQNSRSLEKLYFDEGVEEISANMMVNGCSSLLEINLPSTLKTISGSGAFEGATALKSIEFPKDVVFADTITGVLEGCTSLTSVSLPASVTKIPSHMFDGCTSLTSVTALSEIESIGDGAFQNCSSLTGIDFPGTLTSIGSSAFQGCSSLVSVPDLSKVTKMGSGAFRECRNLQASVDLSSLQAIPGYAFCYTPVKIVRLCDSLKSIGDWAFIQSNVAVQLPETLGKIGNYAFYYGTLPEQLSIPDSVTSVGTAAFSGVDGVKDVTIGRGLTKIPSGMFDDSTVQKITIENSMDDITGSGNLPSSGVDIVYTRESIGDDIGDTVSDGSSQTLQELVNAAPDGKETVIKLEKHVKLGSTLTIPAGKMIKITSDEPYTILAKKSGVSALVNVAERASLELSGKVSLRGRYNKGAIISSKGAVVLSGEAVVYDGTASNVNTGVVDVSGDKASLTMTGGVIEQCELKDAYCGTVHAKDGAHVVMKGGVIRKNHVASSTDGDGNYLSSTGVMLMGNASFDMSGGSIEDNAGYQGGAVVMYGEARNQRASFEMTGGQLVRNKGYKLGNRTPSGAVHVEGNAEFTLKGGKIEDNIAYSDGKGGGVCVVDLGLQQGGRDHTAFTMKGGSVSGNSASAGGGIYTYSDDVTLSAGEIKGNTAWNMGGGVYSEGNEYLVYSTLHIENALVVDNHADKQGGGMWFCPTGDAKIYVQDGGLIAKNTAGEAGDDFVFTGAKDAKYKLTLANRAPGGGKVSWYRDGGLFNPDGTIAATNPDVPRFTPDGDNGEPLSFTDATPNVALKSVMSEDVYKLGGGQTSLTISGNTAKLGGGIGANGGVIIGKSENINIPIKKVWENPRIPHPNKVKVNLKNGDTVIDSITLSESDGWEGTFSNLPQCDASGSKISYTVAEDPVEGYSSKVSGDAEHGFTVTNASTAEVSVPVEKKWVGPAAKKATVRLLADGKDTGKSIDLAESNSWKGSFEGLAKYSKSGSVIAYTVAEDPVEGYSSKVSGDAERGFTVTNASTAEVSVPVEKKWVGPAAKKATVRLLADGKDTGKSIDLAESNSWKGSFEGLAKYSKSGSEVSYTVAENPVEGYSSKVDGDAERGFTVTNASTAEVSVPVEKKWVGPAAAKATVRLLADGEETGKKITLSESDGWKGSFEGLPKYSESGSEVSYTVAENPVEGYSSKVDGDAERGFTVTNASTAKVSVPVEKKWVGPAAAKATVRLLADGKDTGKKIDLDESNNWKGSFEGLPKYSESGSEVSYTVAENPVEGYSSKVDGDAERGFTVTNASTAKVSVPVEKKWVGPAAAKATVRLLADGKDTGKKIDLDESNNWKGSFEGLPKYSESGSEVSYTVAENPVEGYSSKVDGDAERGFTVTNASTAKVSVPVEKKWVGPAAAKATVRLLADGKDTGKKIDLDESNNWKGSFEGLPKYSESGSEVSYTVAENPVEGYSSKVTGDAEHGFTVTNTVKTGELGISKTVVAREGLAVDADKIFKFVVEATDATGRKVSGTYGDATFEDGKATVKLKDGQTAKITGLPAGTTYTVTERAAGGYKTAVNGAEGSKADGVIAADQTATASFTNTFDPAPAVVSVPELTKVLAGGRKPGLQEGEFAFELSLADGAGNVLEGYPIEAKNDKDGKVSFGELSFTNPGTYHATVTEKASGDVLIEDDAHAYTFDVTVTQTGAGLKAEVSNERGKKTFTNTFTPHGNTKTVTKADASGAKIDVDGKLVGVGDTLTYTIGWANNSVDDKGAAQAADVTVTDVLPKGVNYVEGSADGAAYDAATRTLTWSLGEQAAGATGTLSFDVKVSADAATVDDIANTATVKVGENESQTNTTHNSVSRKGSLTVKKTVVGGDSRREFGFTVALADEDGEPVSGAFGKGDGAVTFTDGKAAFTLRDGEKKTITGLPVGARYTVTEDAAEGYTTTVNGADGSRAEGTVTEDGATAAFTNAYGTATEGRDVSTAGLFTKTLKGRDWAEGDSFQFTLTGEDVAPMPEGSADGSKTVSVTAAAGTKAGEKVAFDFGSIRYTLDDLKDAGFAEVGGKRVRAKTFTYAVREARPADGSAIAGVAYDGHVATMTVTVTDDGSGNLTASTPAIAQASGGDFVNTYTTGLDYSARAGVLLSKTLSGRDMEAGQFAFTVTADAKTAAKLGLKTDKNAYTVAAADDGEAAVVDLVGGAAGSDVTFTDADAGKTYSFTVTETKLGGAGYTNDTAPRTVTIAPAYDAATGKLTVTTTVVKDGVEVARSEVSTADDATALPAPVTVAFRNSYEAAGTLGGEGSASIEATKTLAGRAAAAGEFSFSVRDAQGNVVATASNRASGDGEAAELAFSPIAYTTDSLEQMVADDTATRADDGSWTIPYTVSEDTAALPAGVTATASNFDITVKVTDNGRGGLDVAVAYPEGCDGKLSFVNGYGTNEATVDLAGTKTLALGQAGLGLTQADIAGKYTFKIEPLDGAPAPVDDSGKTATEAVNDAAGNVELGHVTFKQPSDLDDAAIDGDGLRTKTFSYRVSESGSVGGVVNDATAAKTFTVKVVEDTSAGTLAAEVLPAEGTPEGKGAFEFTNTYGVGPAPSTVTDQIKVSKKLKGRDLVEGEFEFQLVEINADGSEIVAATGRNADDGTVALGPVTYTAPGSHSYELREVAGTAGGVTYDRATHRVRTTVTDAGNGTLAVKHELVDADGNAANDTSVTFTNGYEAAPVTLKLGAAKVLEGAELKAGQFSFELKSRNGKVMSTARNAADGSVTFDALTFKQAGTYTFTVGEVDDGQAHVTYDRAVHKIVVTVSDEAADGTKTGYLSAKVSYEGDANLPPVFTNSYAEEPGTPETPGIPENPGTPGGGSGGGSDSGSGGDGSKGGMPDTGDRSLPVEALAAMAGIGALAVAGGAALYRRRR